MSPPIASADDHRRRRHEAPAIGAAIRRQVAGLVTRCREGDTEALEELAEIDQAVTRALFTGARGLYTAGHTWTTIGDLLGVSRQAAAQRFRMLDDDTDTSPIFPGDTRQ